MNPKTLRNNFIIYLKQHYAYARPEIMASNVFYSYNNNIGMDFLDIFQSSTSLDQARTLIEKKFVDINRKDPKGHANVHFGCWVKFKEFLDHTFGGVSNINID